MASEATVNQEASLSKEHYLSRVTSLLQQLITTVKAFDNSHTMIQALSKKEGGRGYHHYLSQSCLSKTLKFGQHIRQQAEKLLLELNNINHTSTMLIDPILVDNLTLHTNENNPEKRAHIEQLLTTYRTDLQKKPALYQTGLRFSYQPTLSSPLSSPAFSNNIELLRQHGLINPLNEATLIGGQSFDVRQLLTFDDYRLYLLHYYFKVLRDDLSALQDGLSIDQNSLTPFDLLFNPQLEISHSPQIMALLHFQHRQQLEPLTSFILGFKQMAQQLVNESGELIGQLETRIRALQQTLNTLKSQQQTIESSLKKPAPVQRHPSPKSGKKPFRSEEYHYHQRNTKIQEEINSLKRERALITNNTKLLNDYDRIANLYTNLEKQFLADLSRYLLAKKQAQSSKTESTEELRNTIFQKNLTIKENNHQFRSTEKQNSPHFRDKPFDRQNSRYLNYRKLWLDIIDSMFKEQG